MVTKCASYLINLNVNMIILKFDAGTQIYSTHAPERNFQVSITLNSCF